jgi:hypothetical protein
MPGRVPRHRDDLEREARRVHGLAAGEQGCVALEAPQRDADAAVEVVRTLEDLTLRLRQPDRSAGSIREVGERAEVVVVAVREQDRGARGA